MSTAIERQVVVAAGEAVATEPQVQARVLGATTARYASIAFQLLLVLLVIRTYQLESRTFYNIMMLAVAGFAVHAALPRSTRLPFFAILSMAGAIVAFGWAGGTALLGTGLILIAACHLPIRWGYRIAVLAGLGAVLALGRANVLPFGWNAVIWPILGSMFMFRLALYVHAIRQETFRFSPFRTLAYFFMLPNLVFPLYPVVDYTAFQRNHYDDDELDIYEVGVQWIARGLLQLVLYRLVYQFVVTDATALVNLTDLLRFLLGTFLLYLRVSGSFHLIIGVLYLFGFRLPETHHLYYLASGFTDFWRRINIYWKDFMMKLVYYPSFFRLRRWGTERALVAATVIVFLATWLLHSYQWFWLRGGFPLTAQDLLFWGLLGLLVVRASLKEMRTPRSRALSARGWSASRAVRTVGTFTVLCVLWSLWSSESIMEWLWIWQAGLNAGLEDVSLLAGLLMAGLLVSGRNWGAGSGNDGRRSPWPLQPAVRAAITLVVLLGMAQTDRYEDRSPRLAGVVATLRTPALNARDAELQHRGYYEKLDMPSRLSTNLWAAAVAARPPEWSYWHEVGLRRWRDDFLSYDLEPSMEVDWDGVPFSTNRWGMRDRDRTREKPANTVRMAVVGPSHVMGSHVPDEAVFSAVLEHRLNMATESGPHFEVLNFGIPRYALTQQLALLDDRVLEFEPDIVVITTTNHGGRAAVGHLLEVMNAGGNTPYPGLQKILEDEGIVGLSHKDEGLPVPFHLLRAAARAVGIPARMPGREAQLRAQSRADEINVWAVRESARRIQESGAVPVLLALPTVMDDLEKLPPEVEAGYDAGYTVLDLFNVFEGLDHDRLRVAPWDNHPNAAAHELVAERLHLELQRAGLLDAPRLTHLNTPEDG